MKCKLFALIIFIVASCIFKENISASSHLIEWDELLGCYQDHETKPELDKYIAYKADSMKLAETGDKFRAIAKVYKKYRFTELPSIALYFVGGGEYITNTLRCNYQYVLFNLDDSTMYHFGGKSSQFSRVFSGYLQKKYEPDSILNLLYLFVNTVDSECSYYMIENLQDYDDWHGDHVPWRYEENKKLINNYIKPVHINQYNDYYEVEFYTWHKKMGMMVKLTLDYWKFRITKNEIQLLERIKRQPDYYNGF